MSSDEKDISIKVLMKFRTEILAYLWSILRDKHVAEDIFQDVSIVAFKKAPDDSDEQHVFRWILRAARFEALEYLRQKKSERVVLSEHLLDLLDEKWGALQPRSDVSVEVALNECLEKLTPRSRELVNLRYEKGLTGVALAKRRGVKVSTVYVALSRVHRVLGDCIRMALNRMEGCSDG